MSSASTTTATTIESNDNQEMTEETSTTLVNESKYHHKLTPASSDGDNVIAGNDDVKKPSPIVTNGSGGIDDVPAFDLASIDEYTNHKKSNGGKFSLPTLNPFYSSGSPLPPSMLSSSSSSSLVSTITPRKSIRNRGIGKTKQNQSVDTVEFLEDLKKRSEFAYNGKNRFEQIIFSIFHGSMFWLKNWSLWLLENGQKFIISYMHFAKLPIRIFAYLLMILVTGLIKDYVLVESVLPANILQFIFKNIRSAKRSPLNIYFVKWGWLWTFIALIPFFLGTRFVVAWRKTFNQTKSSKFFLKSSKSKNYETLSSPTDNNDDKAQTGGDQQKKESGLKSNNILTFIIKYIKEILPAAIRLALATGVWYFSVQSFVHIAKLTGHCQSKDNTLVFLQKTIEECVSEGNRWIYGFDISGHIFLMSFSNLLIIEELRYLLSNFEEFQEFNYLGKFRDPNRAQNFVQPYRFRVDSLVHWMGFLFTAVQFMVMIIWDYMMIQTGLFYHILTQKLLGFAWSQTFWFALYRVIPKYVKVLAVVD